MDHPADISALVEELAGLPGSDRLFNPYAPMDDPAAAIRRENLIRYLADMRRREARALLVAEAPGYRGCALTGIPITSERILLNGIARWGLFGEGYRQTSDHPQGVAEMSATILWNALADYADQPPVLWNTVPLHPHKPGNRQSNRTPTRVEQRVGAPYIDRVMALFDFELILGVGRTAQRVLTESGHEHFPLRHPSQGGKADFISGLREALEV
jgi:uracil-DNA glycosylase